MRSRHLIGPRPGSTTPETSVSRLRCDLPNDLLQEGSHRLGIMSLVGAALWCLGTVLYHLTGARTDSGLNFTDAIAVISAIFSIALFAYSRRESNDPRFVLDLGLLYMMLTAVGLSVVSHWEMMSTKGSTTPMISWIG